MNNGSSSMQWLFSASTTTMYQSMIEAFKLIANALSTQAFTPSLDFFNFFFNFSSTGNQTINIANFFTTIAIALLIFNVVYQLYKTIFTHSDKAESPLKVCILTVVGLLLIYSVYPLLELVSELFVNINNWSNVALLGLGGVDFNNVTLIENYTSPSVDNIGMTVIKLIALIILAKTYIKLIVLFGKRYLEYVIDYLFFPLAFAALPADSTRDITKTFIRTFLSSALALVFSNIYLKLFLYAMGNCFNQKDLGAFIIGVIFVEAIGELFMEIERWLSSLGLTNADMYHNEPMFLTSISNVMSSVRSSAMKIGEKGIEKSLFGGKGGKDKDASASMQNNPSPLSPSGSGGAGIKGTASKMKENAKGFAKSVATGKLPFEDPVSKMNASQAGGAMTNAMKNGMKNANMTPEQLTNAAKKGFGGDKFAAGSKAFKDSMNNAANKGIGQMPGKLGLDAKAPGNKIGQQIAAGTKAGQIISGAMDSSGNIAATMDTATAAATICGDNGAEVADAFRIASGQVPNGNATLSAPELARINEVAGGGNNFSQSTGTGIGDIKSFTDAGNGGFEVITADGGHEVIRSISSKDMYTTGDNGVSYLVDNGPQIMAMNTADGGVQFFQREVIQPAELDTSGRYQ